MLKIKTIVIYLREIPPASRLQSHELGGRLGLRPVRWLTNTTGYTYGRLMDRVYGAEDRHTHQLSTAFTLRAIKRLKLTLGTSYLWTDYVNQSADPVRDPLLRVLGLLKHRTFNASVGINYAYSKKMSWRSGITFENQRSTSKFDRYKNVSLSIGTTIQL